MNNNTEKRQEFIVKEINKNRFDSRKNFKKSLLYTASAAFLISACATQTLLVTALYGVCAVLNAWSAARNFGKTCKNIVTTHTLKKSVDQEIYEKYKIHPKVMKKVNKFLKGANIKVR
ncbi:MAG: hypothetical protein HFJ12_03160 [Bacilli bacterium]|nr:hypothetical protein [Bacilli bacterium]